MDCVQEPVLPVNIKSIIFTHQHTLASGEASKLTH